MKKILLISMLLISLVGKGQSDTVPANAFISGTSAYLTADSLRNYGHTFLTSMIDYKPTYDTSRVILCYIDTGKYYTGNLADLHLQNPYVYWQFGYEVTKTEPFPAIYIPNEYTRQRSFVGYLDSSRRPLQKSLIIIQTIKL